MSISFTRYVDITSGVGAGVTVPEREFIARFFTDNPLLPPQSYIEFPNNQDNAQNVGEYFGFSSEEYARSAFQFAWVSKNITQVPSISFARWVDVAQAGVVFGEPGSYVVSNFAAVTNGSLNLTIGGFTEQLTGINLSGDGSLTAVAASLQAAIRAYSAGGADWTAATVVYSSTRASFDLTGGVAGPEAMTVLVSPTGTDLAPLLGWTTGAIIGNGSAVETITQTLSNSSSASNNFGSFGFMTNLDLTQSEIVQAATWNNGLNVTYQYQVPVAASGSELANDAGVLSPLLINLAGCGMTLSLTAGEYPEMAPMMIQAATNYEGTNSVQDYMYQQFALTPSVTSDTNANLYDSLRVNYYGQTQKAGKNISFYQRGQLTGGGTAPTDMNVYANEQWLKDLAASELMQLQLDLAELSANNFGKGFITTTLVQGVVDPALTNGTISVGKPLNPTQKAYITNATGSATAWQQVQNQGWWLNVEIVSFTDTSGATEWKAVYTLIYSKDDVIRLITGTHILI